MTAQLPLVLDPNGKSVFPIAALPVDAAGNVQGTSANPLITGSSDGAGGVADPNAPVLVTNNQTTATGTISTQNLSPNSGAATANSALEISTLGMSTFAVQIPTGSNTLNQPLSFQGTIDGTDWNTIAAGQAIESDTTNSTSALSATIAAAAVGIWRGNCAGLTKVRITMLAANTGSAVVAMAAAPFPFSVGAAALVPVIGPQANDAVANGNPVRTAGIARTASPAAVQSGDVVDQKMTLTGATITRPDTIPEQEWSSGASPITLTTTSQLVKAAAGAGIRLYAKGVRLTCDSAWVANTVQIMDDQTGTPVAIDSIDLPAGANVYNIPFYSHVRTTANKALGVKAANTVTGVCKASFYGYSEP